MSFSEDIQAYSEMQNELLKRHHGKVAVFYRGKLVALEKEIDAALRIAKRKTGAREFFVRELYTPEEQASAIL